MKTEQKWAIGNGLELLDDQDKQSVVKRLSVNFTKIMTHKKDKYDYKPSMGNA